MCPWGKCQGGTCPGGGGGGGVLSCHHIGLLQIKICKFWKPQQKGFLTSIQTIG